MLLSNASPALFLLLYIACFRVDTAALRGHFRRPTLALVAFGLFAYGGTLRLLGVATLGGLAGDPRRKA